MELDSLSSIHWRIVFGGQCIEVFAAGPKSERIADSLFSDLSSGDGGLLVCRFWIRDEDNGDLTVSIESVISKGVSKQITYSDQGACALRLWSDFQFEVCNFCESSLLLHAAAVIIEDQLVIFPGVSGTGKTTLTSSLLKSGASYLTDELVAIDLESNLASGLSRPLNVKHSGKKIFSELIPSAHAQDNFLPNPVGNFVPHRLLNASCLTYPIKAMPPTAIFFPQFGAKNKFSIESLSPGRACLLLLECLVNARNLPNRGIPGSRILTELAPTYKIKYCGEENLYGIIRENLRR